MGTSAMEVGNAGWVLVNKELPFLEEQSDAAWSFKYAGLQNEFESGVKTLKYLLKCGECLQ